MENAIKAGHRPQSGFAMVVILMLLMVLTVMGSIAVYSVRGDVSHTGRDSNHAKAQMVAESAINWGLSALAKEKPSVLAFTAATHASNGIDKLPEYLENGVINNRKLHTWDVTPIYEGVTVEIDEEGWISQETISSNLSLTGSSSEYIAFKVWFPNDSTIRVSGKGLVQEIASQIEMTGTLKYGAALLK
jgi:Tfp pilus assembly protein PilX